MHTALVTKWGDSPKYVSVETPPTPAPDSDLVQVKLIAAGQHRLVKSRAAGIHYSAKTLPHIPGVDGVGLIPSGQIVYFSTMTPTGGSFSEVLNIPKSDITPLPEGLDPYFTAAMVNPAMSSWMAIKKRTSNLPKGWSVLILGATTASGNIAISIARSLGAKRVIGVARNLKAMEELGLDETIQLKSVVSETDFSTVGNVDVILDYLYGEPMLEMFRQLDSKVPVQYVQIGSLAGLDASIPAGLFRSKDVTIRGSGPGAWKVTELRGEYEGMLGALVGAKAKEVKVVNLSDVENAWNEEGERMVFVP